MKAQTVVTIFVLVGAVGAAPASAQQPQGTIAYAVGAAPGGLYAATLGGAAVAQPLAPSQPVADPAWSPDGSRVAYVWQAPNGSSEIRATAATGGAATTIVRNGTDPAWSPEGTRIAYIATKSGNALRTVAAAGGNATTVVRPRTPRNSAITSVAWLSDARLAYTLVRWTGRGLASVTSLRTVAAAGGPSRTIALTPPAGLVLTGDSLSVAPSGESLAVTLAPRGSTSGPPTLAVVPTSGGAPTATIPSTMSGSFSPDGTQLCAVQGDFPVFSTLSIVPATGGAPVPTGITAANCAWRPAGM
jgi:dipeptidyl aminopeptidase/acylaminoacyl peptidase